jgi:nucleoside 2-deoxyribosyltransferase
MKGKPKFYLAGPFFNPAQVDLIKRLEDAFFAAGVDCFSPRSLDENKAGPIDRQAAASIFRKDVQGLLHCNAVLAVLDWKLPEGEHIRLCDGETGTPGHGFLSGPLNIPDSGTVFEMGFAWARTVLAQKYRKTEAFDPVAICEEAASTATGRRKSDLLDLAQMMRSVQYSLTPMDTVIYTERPAEAGLNLMLTQGAKGVINGIEQLKQFLGTSGEPDWDVLKPWTGKFR